MREPIRQRCLNPKDAGDIASHCGAATVVSWFTHSAAFLVMWHWNVVNGFIYQIQSSRPGNLLPTIGFGFLTLAPFYIPMCFGVGYLIQKQKDANHWLTAKEWIPHTADVLSAMSYVYVACSILDAEARIFVHPFVFAACCLLMAVSCHSVAPASSRRFTFIAVLGFIVPPLFLLLASSGR